MKLAGYIREFKEVMFTIPIYKSREKYYFHIVNDRYKIAGFEEAGEDVSHFIPINTDLDFKNGQNAAIVFKGKEETLIYGSFISAVAQVRAYFQRAIRQGEYENAEEDIQYFESLIGSSVRSGGTVRLKVKKINVNINLKSALYILRYLKQDTEKEELTGNDIFLINSMYDKVLNSDNRKAAIIEFRNNIRKRPSSRRAVRPLSFKGRVKGSLKKGSGYHYKRNILISVDLGDKINFLKSTIEEVVENKKFLL